jgi:PAS domain S-box-containing protein
MKMKMEQFPATNLNPVINVANDGVILYSNEAGEPLLHEWGVKVGEKLPSHIGDIVQRVISLNNPEKIKVEAVNRVYLVVFSPLPEQKCVNISGFDITDCKQVDELYKTEQRLAMATSATELGIFELDSVTGDIIGTEQFGYLVGFRTRPTTTKPVFQHYHKDQWAKWVHPDDWLGLWAKINACQSQRCPLDAEYRVTGNGSAERWVNVRGMFHDDDQGNATHFIGVLIDITKRRQSEEALLEKEAELKLIADNTPVILNRLNCDLKFVFANRACAEMFDRTQEEIIGRSIIEILGEDAFETIRPHIEKVLQGHRVEYETEIPYKGVGPRLMQVVYIPERNMQDEVVGWLASIMDITDHKNAEKALQESEALFSAFMDNNPANAWMKDEQGAYIFLNKASVDRIGIERENFLGKTDFEVFPRDAYQLRKSDNEVLASNKPIAVEEEIVNPDGRCIQWLSFRFPFKDAFGKICVGGISVDITERKRAEDELAAAHTQIQNIIDNTPDIVYAFDQEERFVLANKAVANVLNSTPDRMIGKRRHEFMPKNDADWHEANDRQVFEVGRALEFEECSHLEDRSITWLTKKFPLRDAQGRIYAVAGISADITKRKRAEEALKIANENLEAKVTERTKELNIAYESLRNLEIVRKREIHHRIKNNLQVISSLLDLQAEKFRYKNNIKDSQVLEAFKESQDRVLSMALIHEELHKGGELDTLNFSGYIQELADNLFISYRLGNEGTSLDMDIEENIFFNMDTAVPLGIIVNELISNSLKYAFFDRNKGEIIIKLQREKKEECEIEGNKSTNYVLSISDNGIGIPEDLDIKNLDSLGLQLVTTLVDQLNGELKLIRDNGTKFIIRLKVT